jgi:hypothetical protein
LQKDNRITDDVFGNNQLFVSRLIHERVLVSRSVEKLHFVIRQLNALDGFLGPEAHVRLDVRAHVAHFDLDHGSAFAGNHDFALENLPELAIIFHNMALAQRIGIDLHRFFFRKNNV